MGCAPLGSRYSPGQSIRALERALDAGVTWFDVAPAYGAGQAEAILGRFLKGRRDAVQVATKVGLRAPRMGLAKRIALPLARPVVATLKKLRNGGGGTGGNGKPGGGIVNDKLALSPDFIVQTLETSLKALGTDQVDLFLLHEPTPAEVVRDDVLQTLESLRKAGKARHLGVAGSHEAGLAAAATGAYQVVQMADSPDHSAIDAIRAQATAPIGLISHSVFGNAAAQAQAHSRLQSDPALAAAVQGADQVHRLLLWRALASNPDGVVLASLARLDNLADNLAAALLDPAMLDRDPRT
ncbi:hypothetical protein IP83_01555 [Novosphingobium sp. AAP93]|nr:hypothetical protein IP83_01555 [Novosphingobium sp. AAP93]